MLALVILKLDAGMWASSALHKELHLYTNKRGARHVNLALCWTPTCQCSCDLWMPAKVNLNNI